MLRKIVYLYAKASEHDNGNSDRSKPKTSHVYVDEPINDEKCLKNQKRTEKSHTVFKASKHNSDLKEEKEAFMICFLCYCDFRLIVSHSRGILVLLYVLVLSIQKMT